MEWLSGFADPRLIAQVLTASGGTFVGILVAVPVIVLRLPCDYFQKPQRTTPDSIGRHPLLRGPLLIIKNLAAVCLLLAGALMLILPGQGLLTMMVGLLLLDFPGKFRFERWLISNALLLHSLNRLRRMGGQAPLEVEVLTDGEPTQNKGQCG